MLQARKVTYLALRRYTSPYRFFGIQKRQLDNIKKRFRNLTLFFWEFTEKCAGNPSGNMSFICIKIS